MLPNCLSLNFQLVFCSQSVPVYWFLYNNLCPNGSQDLSLMHLSIFWFAMVHSHPILHKTQMAFIYLLSYLIFISNEEITLLHYILLAQIWALKFSFANHNTITIKYIIPFTCPLKCFKLLLLHFTHIHVHRKHFLCLLFFFYRFVFSCDVISL